ncbi:MAG: hypothetical protein IJ019_04100 [Alphaproteobacteria bacterium]|nr:hypothetical protein [Alphaproteobacteria bacterium]
MSDNKENNRFKKFFIFCLRNIVNVIFCCLTIYYGLLSFVLQISPLENKIILAIVVVLWLLWLFAKAIITMVLSIIIVLLILYGWYYYTNYEQISCKNSGGVWNEQTQVCEEKVDLLQRIKNIWKEKTFLKVFFHDDKEEKESKNK